MAIAADSSTLANSQPTPPDTTQNHVALVEEIYSGEYIDYFVNPSGSHALVITEGETTLEDTETSPSIYLDFDYPGEQATVMEYINLQTGIVEWAPLYFPLSYHFSYARFSDNGKSFLTVGGMGSLKI